MYKYSGFKIVLLVLQLLPSHPHHHPHPLSLHPPTMGEGAVTGGGGQAGGGEVSVPGARLL